MRSRATFRRRASPREVFDATNEKPGDAGLFRFGEASRRFTAAFDEGRPNPRLHRMAADARRYVRAAAAHDDVVVADNHHPARSGSGALYTVEHFEAIRDRMKADGVFCQWLPLHQLDLATLRSIVRSFVAVYWAARDRFIDAGRDVTPSRDVRVMSSRVREPLLSVLRTSAIFAPRTTRCCAWRRRSPTPMPMAHGNC